MINNLTSKNGQLVQGKGWRNRRDFPDRFITPNYLKRQSANDLNPYTHKLINDQNQLDKSITPTNQSKNYTIKSINQFG